MLISHPAGNGVAGWKHAVLHFIRLHANPTLKEVIDWAEEIKRIRAALSDERGEFPGPSALCKSFDCAPMRIWHELLRISSEPLDQSGHAAIDATHFNRRQVSTHYLSRCDRKVQTVQATFTMTRSVKRDERRPAGRPAEPRRRQRLRRYELPRKTRSEGVKLLIKHRVFAPYDHAHDAQIEDDLYNQLSVCETVNSVVKRSYGSVVRARAWCHQFREITLAAAVYNVKRALKQ